MCRRTRLHLPGGFYFLCVERSDNEPPFFIDADDYLKFENILAESLQRYEARLHAYCWERRGIRLLIEVSHIPVAKLMEQQLKLYQRYFARAHPECHQVLHTRYRAILFDPDDYLLPYVRYLHWRPAIVSHAPTLEWSIGCPEGYGESSHRAYLSKTQKRWLTVRTVLWSLCGATDMHAAYRRFMAERPTPADIAQLEQGSAVDPRVLGNQYFLCRLPRDWPVHRSQKSIQDIIASVALHFGIDASEINPHIDGEDAVLIRAVVAWHVTQRKIAKLCDLESWLGRKPSSLIEAIDRYRTLRPELFTLAAIRDAGPLLPMRAVQALVTNKSINVANAALVQTQPERRERVTRLAS